MDELMTFAFLGSLGTTEMMMIFVVILILFGPKQLPQIARTIGKGLRDIRRAANQIKHEVGLDELENEIYRTAQPSRPPRREPPAEKSDPSREPATVEAPDPSREPATVDSETATATSTDEPQLPRHGPQPEDEETP